MPNRLGYPAGVSAKVDQSALNGAVRLSAVAKGRTFLNLLTGAGAVIQGANQTSLFDSKVWELTCVQNFGGGTTISGASTAIDSDATFAAIFKSATIAGTQLLLTGTNNTNGYDFGVDASSHPQVTWVGLISAVASNITLSSNVPYFLAISVTSAANKVEYLVVNLLTGAVFRDTSTAYTPGPNASSGTYTIGNRNVSNTNGAAAILFASGGAPKGLLSKWSDDPWSFWYPRRQANNVAASTASVIVFNLPRRQFLRR